MTDPVARSEALDKALTGDVDEEIRRLFRFGARTRRLTYMLIVSVLFDIVLSVALGVIAFQARNASSSARLAKRDVVIQCEAGNTTRSANRDLWGYILSLPPQTPRTAAQEQQAAEFKQYVANVFAARQC